MKTINLKLLVTVIWCSSSLHSQDYKILFPTADAVYKNLSREVTIKSSEAGFLASSKFSEDLIFSSDNAVKMMSRGHIYHSSFNELKKWDAYSIAPGNKKNKIANTNTNSSRQDYIFYDDTKATSFDFLGVTAGSVRHLEYEIEHQNLHLLTPYYLERYFPVLDGELKINFPSSIKLKYVIKGLHADKVIFTEIKKKDKITYSFKYKDLPGIQNYPDAPDNSYYATHIIFFIEQIEQNGKWQNFLSSVDDLYKFNYDFIKNTNKDLSPELKSFADSLVAGLSTDLEKAKKVYKWVQSHIKYVAFEDGMEGFIPREANLVFNRRFGDCKDMASILTAMLNHIKVPAYFTWIGTRSLPYFYSELPLPIVDNHMICAVKINGKFIMLDGTDDGCIFGIPSSAIQGKEAMIAINEKEYKIIKVETPPKEENNYIDSTFLEMTPSGLVGELKIKMTGYFASDLQSILNYKNEKEKEDYLKNRFNRGNNKIKFSNWIVNQTENEAFISAKLELQDYLKVIGSDLLLNLNIFKFYEHEEIDFPKRKIPIKFSYLNSCTYITLLKVPPGYKVSYQPKNQIYKNDIWGFVMEYQKSNDFIALKQVFDNNSLMLHPKDFQQWNQVLENLYPHYKQSIVLTKN